MNSAYTMRSFDNHCMISIKMSWVDLIIFLSYIRLDTFYGTSANSEDPDETLNMASDQGFHCFKQ